MANNDLEKMELKRLRIALNYGMSAPTHKRLFGVPRSGGCGSFFQVTNPQVQDNIGIST